MSGPGPVTRQERIDAALRERRIVALERQAMALERIADELKTTNNALVLTTDLLVGIDALLARFADPEGAVEPPAPSADVR